MRLTRVDLDATRDFLLKNEEFLLRLVENPMVFEHESFTDLILAISHLTEELKVPRQPLSDSRRMIRATSQPTSGGSTPCSSPSG